MDDCARAYSFSDHALLRLQERIKDAVDPNGILSAGRYGIWPRHLRQGQLGPGAPDVEADLFGPPGLWDLGTSRLIYPRRECAPPESPLPSTLVDRVTKMLMTTA
jgi:hypothetical protein